MIVIISITKEECEAIRRKIPEPFITICSKHKYGAKGQKASGKTYYCPESAAYLNIVNKMRQGKMD